MLRWSQHLENGSLEYMLIQRDVFYATMVSNTDVGYHIYKHIDIVARISTSSFGSGGSVLTR